MRSCLNLDLRLEVAALGVSGFRAPAAASRSLTCTSGCASSAVGDGCFTGCFAGVSSVSGLLAGPKNPRRRAGADALDGDLVGAVVEPAHSGPCLRSRQHIIAAVTSSEKLGLGSTDLTKASQLRRLHGTLRQWITAVFRKVTQPGWAHAQQAYGGLQLTCLLCSNECVQAIQTISPPLCSWLAVRGCWFMVGTQARLPPIRLPGGMCRCAAPLDAPPGRRSQSGRCSLTAGALRTTLPCSSSSSRISISALLLTPGCCPAVNSGKMACAMVRRHSRAACWR